MESWEKGRGEPGKEVKVIWEVREKCKIRGGESGGGNEEARQR
jgi:hypothetical protein